MPTFITTKADYLASRVILKNIENSIEGEFFLGVNGYNVFIRLDLSTTKGITTRVIGPSTDINELPTKVLDNYLKVKDEIRKWKRGNLPDFPDFSKRF